MLSSSMKTVNKVSGSSTRLSKAAMKPVAGKQQDDKITKKKPAKNAAVAIPRQPLEVLPLKKKLLCLSDELLPLKKRRLVLPYPSIPPPDTGNTLSTQDSASGQGSFLDPLPAPGPSAILPSQVTDDQKSHELANLKVEDSMSEPVGDAAYRSMDDDTHDDNAAEPLQTTSPLEKVSDSRTISLEKEVTSQGTQESSPITDLDVHTMGAVTSDSISDPDVHTTGAGTCVDFQEGRDRNDNSTIDVTTDDTSRPENTDSSVAIPSPRQDIDESKIHMKCPGMSTECPEEMKIGVGKVSASRKNNRLKWDLNTVMDSWDLSDDDCEDGILPCEHIESLEKLETSRVCNNSAMEITQSEMCGETLLDPVVSQMTMPETNSTQSEGISPPVEQMIFCSHDVEYPESKLDDMSALSGTSFDGQLAVAEGMEETDKETPAPDPAHKDNFMNVQHEQIPNSCHILGNGHIAGVKNRRDHYTGYESPFEDGELRELDALALEENEVGSETECVDYEFDEKDDEELDARNHCVSETGSEIYQTDKGSSTEKPVDSALEEVDGLIVKSFPAEEVEATEETRSKVFRQPDEQLYSGGLQEERNEHFQRRRYTYDPSLGYGRHQDERQGGRGSARKLPPTSNEYPQDYSEPHSRSFNAGWAGKTDKQRDFVHNTSNNYRQPFDWRRSPSDSNRGRAVEGRHRKNFRVRDRPVIYQEGVSRGPRDEYGHMCDSAPSSVQQPHYTGRREGNFSPGRDNIYSHHPRRRSCSRSPLPWDIQRDRSPRGMSTNFRADTNMTRGRKTFRKSNDEIYDDEVMASHPSSNSSPPRNTSWRDDRKYGAQNFRGRKNSGRFDCPEPMKSGDCYRSTTRPGRFTEMSGCRGRGRGRGRGYHNSDRYGYPQRPVPKQFNYGTEDCWENEGEKVRDTDGRDAPPQTVMEERGLP